MSGVPADTELVAAIVGIVGDDPWPSLLFGAPALSLQHLERHLSLDPHTLDPTKLVSILQPVAYSSFGHPHTVEHRQLKRGKGFEDWLVFKPDPLAVVTERQDGSRSRTGGGMDVSTDPLQGARAPRIDKAGLALPDIPLRRQDTARHDDTPRRAAHHVNTESSRPDALLSNHGRRNDEDLSPPITLNLDPSLPGRTPDPPSETSKAKSFLRPLLLRKKKDQATPQASQPALTIDQGIALPPPHRVVSQLYGDVPVVPEPLLPILPTTHRSGHENGTSGPRPVVPEPTGYRDLSKTLGAGLEKAPFNRPESASTRLEEQAALHRRLHREGSQKEDIGARGRTTESGGRGTVDDEPDGRTEEEEADSMDEGENNDDDPGSSAPPTPLSSTSSYSSDGSDASHRSSSLDGSISKDDDHSPAASLPPTPWLSVAFQDLPFGPDVPALHLSDVVKGRWQFLAAQVVGVLVCVWVLHLSGL